MAGWQRASVVHRPCRCRVQDRRCGRALTNALPRGLATLRAFVLDQKLLGNVEIAKVTGLPKPTVSYLTFTLASASASAWRAGRPECAVSGIRAGRDQPEPRPRRAFPRAAGPHGGGPRVHRREHVATTS
ncbi:MAG: hypothetical protein E6R10_00460 [Rhodocyclaceae bacterium]|nr:MAG: hypothetical protein E6R10_00460 [Rhodocyclaceae bacterium]